jgi:hypothetical protein
LVEGLINPIQRCGLPFFKFRNAVRPGIGGGIIGIVTRPGRKVVIATHNMNGREHNIIPYKQNVAWDGTASTGRVV